MTTFEQEIEARMKVLKMERKCTYADAIGALRDFGEDIVRRQARIDTRYAQGKGESALTKLMEDDVEKMRRHMEGMVFMVGYMFDIDQREVTDDID